MNIKSIFLLMAVMIIATGCYGALQGKIVDAETGEPIEGAVAMAEWTRTKGFGNTYTVSVKVSEAVSDKEGNFELDSCYSPFVNKPSLTIYKKGYAAWNNEYIFPDWQKRVGFEWKSGQVFRMERFREDYSYNSHRRFITAAINSTIGKDDKKLIKNAYSWELERVNLELKKN